MPWKNGGGETQEIAVHPPQASLDALHWRISMAGVISDGPFSLFPGIERTLCVLQGHGLQLDMGTVHSLTVDSAPLRFAADQPVRARLVDGPIMDLNIMTRRDSHRHAVRRMTVTARKLELPVVGTTVVFCERGSLQCTAAGKALTLAAHDALLLDASDDVHIGVVGTPTARLCLIHIEASPA